MLDDSARRRLGSTRFGDVRWHAEVGSTNSVVADLARSGEAEGVVVVADHQTAGRGRRGRTWESAPGDGLLLSVLLRPALSVERTPLLTLVMALSASEACEEVAGVVPLLKWPNDLLVGEGKVGGVLGETVSGLRGLNAQSGLRGLNAESGLRGLHAQSDPMARSPAVVLGIGVNVRAEAALPPGCVALEAVAGRPVDRAELLVALLEHLDARYTDLDVAQLLAGYRARSGTLERRVRVDLATSAVEGTAMDVTPEGHLVLDVGGTQRVVHTGDVVHLHATPRR